MLTVFFFGALGDKAGMDRAQLDVNCATPAAVRNRLAEGNPELGRALSEPQVMVAVNQDLAGWETALSDGDEVAFLPPVTGG